MAPRLTVEQQQEIWDRLAAGESMRSIARSIHKGQATVRDLIAKSGGIRPVIPSRWSELRLSLVEREEISRGLARGESARRIAERLGRAPSTISREIARNGGAGYRACDAEAFARRRARRPKRAKLARCRRLRRVVEAKLALEWAPQQIAAWLAEEYPSDPEMRVSHETIYMSLFIQGRGALRQELHRSLRTGRAIRRPRGTRQPDGRGILRDMVLISERPAEVKDRAVPGHWEGDLIFGKRMTAIGTLVERLTSCSSPCPTGTLPTRFESRWPNRFADSPPNFVDRSPWIRAASSPSTLPSRSTPVSRSTSVIPSPLGSVARTRTPTGCSVSTSPGTPTCPCTPRPTSTPWRAGSTVALDKPSAGSHHQRH